MYNALNEDVMFQEMRDRVDRMQASRGAAAPITQGRRWWRKAAHLAR